MTLANLGYLAIAFGVFFLVLAVLGAIADWWEFKEWEKRQ
jgi:hypothetical protein